MKAANVPLVRPFWVMTTRSLMAIRLLRDGNGNLAFDPEIRTGTLLGYPFYEENQIPENLGGPADESEVYFCEATQLLIGDTMQMAIEVFPGGAWNDGSVVQSGISNDQTVVRAISLHDFVMRHDRGACVINTIDWL